MILAQVGEWFKSETGRHLAVILITVLVFTLGFGLGHLSRRGAGDSPLTITSPEASDQVAPVNNLGAGEPKGSTQAQVGVDGAKFVASKNGKRYYLPRCSGVERIKPENLIGFASREEAEARGLTPAANCPGLE